MSSSSSPPSSSSSSSLSSSPLLPPSSSIELGGGRDAALAALALALAVAGSLLGASAADWRAYRARGALGLGAAFALAGAFLTGAPLLFARWWPALRPADADDGGPDARWLFVLGGVLSNTLTSVLGNLLFLPIYWFAPAWAERRRTGTASFPWRAPLAEARRAFWEELLPRSLLRVTLNHALVPPLLVVIWGLLPLARRQAIFAAELPSAAALVWQLAACAAVEDVLFYASHRLMHSVPFLYKHVHSVHHEWRVTTTLAAEHAHVLEFVVGNLGPATAGALLLQVHALTLWMFIVVRVCVSFEEHAGYAFECSPCRLLPCGATVDGHDYHHANSGSGIFASEFTLLDTFLGTEGGFGAWRSARRGGAAKKGEE
jgi:sterol desaturase/sphingolipid hydroxylase (fatty acid hydroxylase superfamily)